MNALVIPMGIFQLGTDSVYVNIFLVWNWLCYCENAFGCVIYVMCLLGRRFVGGTDFGLAICCPFFVTFVACVLSWLPTSCLPIVMVAHLLHANCVCLGNHNERSSRETKLKQASISLSFFYKLPRQESLDEKWRQKYRCSNIPAS